MNEQAKTLDQAKNQKDAAPILPEALRARLNGELDGQSIIAWAEFDLDEQNRYRQQFAVLTEKDLIVLDGSAAGLRVLELARVKEAKIIEGLGVDRLQIIGDDDRLAAEMRYSRRQRRDMTRLQRKIDRRRPRKDGEAELPPEWLEIVERREEKAEHCAKCGEVIPSYAEGVCPRCLHQRKILWRLLDIAKPYRRRVWLALTLTIIGSALVAMPNFIQKFLIDRAIVPVRYDAATHQMVTDAISESARMHRLLFWAGVLVASILVTEICGGWRLRVLAMLGTQITYDLRHMVYSHMHELSLRFFAKRRTGSLITRVTNDTDRLWDFVVFGSVDLVRDVAMIVFFAAVMFAVSWKLAIVALLPLPPLAVVTYKRGMKMQSMFGRLWTYWSRLTAVVGDALPGVRVVKAFANEHREIRRFDRRSDEYADKEREIHVIWSSLQPVVSGLMRFGSVLIWVVGGYLVIRQHDQTISVGTLVMFGGFVWQFYQPIMELANSNRMVTRAATSAQRIFEVLDTPPDIYSRQGAVTKDRLEGKVEFRNVSFSYEGAQPALRRFR